MNYSDLISRAYNLSWKHKTFWIFGFLSASWGYLGTLENKFPDFAKNYNWAHDIDPHIFEDIVDWLTSGPGIAVAVAMVGLFFIVGLVMFILYLISVASLIEGVVRVENGDSFKLIELFKAGVRHIWSFLGLFFITLISGGIYFAMLGVSLILLLIALELFGLIFLIFIFPLAFIGIFLLSNLYSLAQREIVINGASVFEAISIAFQLLKNNVGSNIIIFLITTFLWMIIVLCGLILALIFAIPAIIIGAWSPVFMIIALVVILPVLLLIAIVVEGFLGTFFNSLFTYFYLELTQNSIYSNNQENSDSLPAN